MPTYTLKIALELFCEAMDAADRYDRERAIRHIVETYEIETELALKKEEF